MAGCFASHASAKTRKSGSVNLLCSPMPSSGQPPNAVCCSVQFKIRRSAEVDRTSSKRSDSIFSIDQNSSGDGTGSRSLEPLAIGAVTALRRMLQSGRVRQYDPLLEPATEDFVLIQTGNCCGAVEHSQQLIPSGHI